MIEVDNLTKYYGTKIALDKVSFTVRKGEVLGFLGPNGAGKSTAMKIITCYLSPTEGSVKVDGLDVFDDSLEVRKRIGYLPETPPLYLDMTVKNYLEFAAKIKGVDKKNLQESVDTVVDKCGLSQYYRSQCRALSKGFRQRVGIAQAMVHNPLVLILDEPTIGLDPIQIVEIRHLIKSFGGEHTVVLSTHILPEVDMTCERVIIINDGTVVAEDTTSNLRSRLPQTEQIYLEIRGNSSQLLSKLEAIQGINSVNEDKCSDNIIIYEIKADNKTDVRPEIAKTVIGENLELLQLKDVSLTLEDIFINVTMK
ncbi:MAG: ATP-binding cassette domain-containing protein [Candidatus Latescibacteria bacterium]|nr:ATP-binding cassette domain-containing protein [Candidatus Latescibacterota bacterium]